MARLPSAAALSDLSKTNTSAVRRVRLPFSETQMKLSSLAAYVVFATALLGTHAAANAQSANYGPPGVAVWQYCYAEELTSFPNRVHVYCPYVMSSFKYIAVPTSSSAEAGRLIA